METLFAIQSLVIIVCIPIAVVQLGLIAIPYFLEPFISAWTEARRWRRREWEQQTERKIEVLERENTLLKDELFNLKNSFGHERKN